MFKIYRLRFPFLWISILLLLVFLDKVFLHSLFSTHHITQENEANSLAKRIDQGDQEDVMIHQQFFNYLKENLRDTPFAGSINYTRYQVARLGLLSLTNVTPLIPEFGPVYNDVTSFKYPILIEPCTIFQNTTSNSLFVAIISAPSYFPKRSSIRQTWLGQLKNVSSLNLSGYAFIVGKTEDKNVQTRIEEESRLFGDILQVGMIDTYNQLSIKAVGLINWLHNHCSGVDFVLKVDDDVYVNPRNLVAVANALNRSELSLYGKKTLSKTQRGISFILLSKFKITFGFILSFEFLAYKPYHIGPSKWQTNFDEWPWKKYPPYVFGATVIIPGTAIKLLLAAAQTVPYFRFEDTFLLALCSNKANIQIRGNDR